MGIRYDETKQTFSIDTLNSTYQFQVNLHGFLLHLYYGSKVRGNADYLIKYLDRGFSGNPACMINDRTFSMDVLPQELPVWGSGDFRSPAFVVEKEDGTRSVDLKYVTYQIRKGKYSLRGLPAVYVCEEESKDAETLAQGFAQITTSLAAIVGRVQGAIAKINGIVNKINGVTSLIAQGVRAPKELAQALVSAVFGIVAGVMEIKNAAYFMGSNDDSGESNSSENSAQFVKRNEKNVLMNFITAYNYELSQEAITEQQYNTKTAVENLYKTLAFGAAAQLLTQLEPTEQTYESVQGFWNLLERLEEAIDKENPDVYAAVEETRITSAEVLLSYEYDTELIKHIKKEMPLLALAVYLGCDADKIRSLNAISDSFLIKGDVVYV